PALGGLGSALCPWHDCLPWLEVGNEAVQARVLHVGDQPGRAETALALGALGLEQVPLPAAASLELAGARRLEALGRGPPCLHLRHMGCRSFLIPLSPQGERAGEGWSASGAWAR